MCATVPAFAADTPSPQTAPVTQTIAAAGAGPQEVAQANPFSDVPPNSWAYEAIAKLASEGLIKGYPDGQFKGQRPITRYEAAVLVNRAVDYLEAKISAGQKVSADDMATVKALVDQFRPELAQVQAHLKDLDTKVAALSTQVGANTTTLARQQFHLYYFLRAPGDFSDSVAAFNPATNGNLAGALNAKGCTAAPCPLIPNTKLTTAPNYGAPGAAQGQNTLTAGQNTFGTAYQTLRMIFSGSVDSEWSYAIRLEDRYYFENAALPTGSAAITPAYCTSAACTAPLDYPANGTLRINYAYAKWSSPTGFYAQFGRILPLESLSDLGGQLLGLAWADYFNGAQIGYIKNGLQVEGGYGVGQAGSNNASGSCIAAFTCPGPFAGGTATPGLTQQDFWVHGDYDFIPHHLNVGAAYITELGNNELLWNPAAPIYTASGTSAACAFGVTAPNGTCGALEGSGLYEGSSTPMRYGSIYGTWRFSDNLHINAEFGHMLGNDPFTGSSWYQPNAIWVLGTLGNPSGPKGSAWGEIGYIGSGFNGVSPETDITGTTGYAQLYISGPNDYAIWYGGLHYRAGNNVDIGLIYQYMNLLPGTTVPASSVACPGCYVSTDAKSSIFLQSLIAF